MRTTPAILLALLAVSCSGLEPVRPSGDGKGFVRAGAPFLVWGVNYDHDPEGRLLEDYWTDEWETVVEDFGEIKQLGANVVRIHLQVARFMDGPDRPNSEALAQLARLVALAERRKLYLDVTGLGCYHKKDVPAWYDALDEAARWKVQARFWESVAKTCAGSPAIFCYDLMNEPILPGKKPETDWLGDEFGGKHFVQRVALDSKGRTREEIAKAWVDQLVAAIRKHDTETMITVGVIPWALIFRGAKPLFYSEKVRKNLDFASVHFYPRAGKVDEALTALAVYDVGMPLVIEEMFPLKCSQEEMAEFIDRSRTFTDGWISFYWGRTPDELEKDGTLQSAILRSWLLWFQKQPK